MKRAALLLAASPALADPVLPWPPVEPQPSFLPSMERFGPINDPSSTIEGFVTAVELFRVVCTSLDGATELPDLTELGFNLYTNSLYLYGDDSDVRQTRMIYSPTGDIDVDEVNEGRPVIMIRLTDEGRPDQCWLTWSDPVNLPADQRGPAVRYLRSHLATTLPAIPLNGTTDWAQPETTPFGSDPFTRPCGTGWCDVSVIYSLGGENGFNLDLSTDLPPITP